MEKVHPSCGQSSDRGRLKNRTEQPVGGIVAGLEDCCDVALELHRRLYRYPPMTANARSLAVCWIAADRGGV